MSIQDWGAVGEVAGAVFILVTLVYLSVQVRMSRKEIAAAAVNNLLESFSAVNQAIIASEEVALLYAKGLENPKSLTRGEQIRFQMLVRETLNGYDAIYRQFREGVVQKDVWESFVFHVYASTPGVNQFLESGDNAHVELSRYLDNVEKVDPKNAVSIILGGVLGDA